MKLIRFIPLLVLASLAIFYGARVVMPAKAMAGLTCCTYSVDCPGDQVCIIFLDTDDCSQDKAGYCEDPEIQ